MPPCQEASDASCLRRRHECLDDTQAQAQAAVGGIHHHVLNVAALAATADELQLHNQSGSCNDLLLVQVCAAAAVRQRRAAWGSSMQLGKGSWPRSSKEAASRAAAEEAQPRVGGCMPVEQAGATGIPQLPTQDTPSMTTTL